MENTVFAAITRFEAITSANSEIRNVTCSQYKALHRAFRMLGNARKSVNLNAAEAAESILVALKGSMGKKVYFYASLAARTAVESRNDH
jgi:hypothetical protein